VIYTRPVDCDKTEVKDSFDPSVVGSGDIKDIVKQVTDGKFSPSEFQKILDGLSITDIVVEVVGQPTCDGVKGKITVVITIVKSGRTKDQIRADITKALGKFFNIDITRIETTLQDAKNSATTKRSILQGGSSFLSQSVVSPADDSPAPGGMVPGPQPPNIIVPTPGSAARVGFGLLAVWLVGLLALLF
jgi:hypothetical protein